MDTSLAGPESASSDYPPDASSWVEEKWRSVFTQKRSYLQPGGDFFKIVISNSFFWENNDWKKSSQETEVVLI